MYRLKYQSDQSTVPRLARVVAEFIVSKKLLIDVVVPLPPSKQRRVQPVRSIAESVANDLILRMIRRLSERSGKALN